MDYDFNLIKISKTALGNAMVDMAAFFAKHGDIAMPEAFDKELTRLSLLPYSEDLVDKIRDVARRGILAAGTPTITHYAVHSTVRSRFNRNERAQAPQHARFKQHVLPGQRRLIRGRPVLISEAELHQHLDSLLDQHKANLLEVRTEDGRFVDLHALAATRQPMVTGIDWAIEPGLPAPMAPHPVMDSVANDRPTGIPFPRFPGGKQLNKDEISQVVSGMATAEGDLEVDEKTGTVTVAQEGTSEPELEVDEPEVLHGATEAQDGSEEEEIEDLPPGIPPPPPPPGGQPRPNNKKKHRR